MIMKKINLEDDFEYQKVILISDKLSFYGKKRFFKIKLEKLRLCWESINFEKN